MTGMSRIEKDKLKQNETKLETKMVLHLLLSPSITLILSEVLINLNLNILIFLFFL